MKRATPLKRLVDEAEHEKAFHGVVASKLLIIGFNEAALKNAKEAVRWDSIYRERLKGWTQT